MTNLKQILFLVLALVLTLAFVACDNDEQGESSSSPVSESQSETEAQKPENAVTVKFDTQGGTEIKDAFVEKGENIPKPSDPERVGYTFDGWYVENEKWSFVGYVVTKDITLTAKWTPIQYTITFAGNVTNLSIKYTIADSFDLPNGNAKDLYKFEGWFEDKDFTKPISKIEKGTYGNKTIYAKTAYSGVTFTLKNDEYSVTKCDTNATEVVIPSNYNGKSVTSIDIEAFRDCTSLRSVTIPESVTSIGGNAFNGCSSLTSVTIPDSVTSIGEYAFAGCTKLTSITIPNSVTSIGDFAFGNCTSLTSVTIGDSVTMINYRAFYGCTSLTSVTIPDSVILIGEGAFEECTSLTSVTIGDSVTLIGEDAFYDCTSLKYNEYDNVLYLGNDTNPYVVLVKAKDTSITSCTINENTKIIFREAFYYCTSLTSVTIGNSVTSIGEDAFRGCTSLTSVTIPSSVTSIGSYAFYKCTSLTSVTIGNSVTSIGWYAFYGCSKLTSVTIGNSVTTIGSSAFYDCTSLTIYCEATSQPSGWDSLWNRSYRPVYWYSESAPTTDGKFWHYGTNGEIVIWE